MKGRGVFWRTAFFVVSILTIAAGILIIARQTSLNREAIEKSCILQNNLVIHSQKSKTNQILVAEILRNAVEHGRAYVVKQFTDESGKERIVLLVNCHKVANHPEAIHAEAIKTLPAHKKKP
jgi:hypothetical protein